MAEEEASEAQQKKSPLLLFIVIALVLVAGSIGGTLFFLSGGGDEEVVEEEVDPPAIYFAINPKFQTNYDVNGRPRLFQLAIALVTREQDVVDALGMHLPTIKSRLVILLSGQKFETLQTPEGRQQLREQSLAAVREILNAEIGKPGVEQVLFTDFVMQ